MAYTPNKDEALTVMKVYNNLPDGKKGQMYPYYSNDKPSSKSPLKKKSKRLGVRRLVRMHKKYAKPNQIGLLYDLESNKLLAKFSGGIQEWPDYDVLTVV